MSTWFTSDLHWGHLKVIEYCNRPYSSVEEMNEAIIRNWNELVKPDDTVYCTGDLSLNFRFVEQYSPRLMGTKFLVPGNHDEIFPGHKKNKRGERMAEWKAKYEAVGWNVLPIHGQLDLPDVGIVNVCHMPYTGDSGYQDRYVKYRMIDDGKFLIHGHTHSKDKMLGRQIHVGVDANDYRPVHLDQVIELVKSYKEEK